jgi:signal transduction histidine kinase
MMRFRPRLRTLVLALALLTFGLSWAGLIVLRVYDNQLLRQTEGELIAEAGFATASYREALRAQGAPPDYGVQIAPALAETLAPAGKPLGLKARLALGADVVRPPAEPARPPEVPADPLAVAAGRRVTPLLAAAKPIALSGVRVVDARGVVVASSGLEEGTSIAHREEVRRALAGEAVSLMRRRISDDPSPAYQSPSRETGVRVFVAVPVVDGDRLRGAVVMSRTPMTLGKAFYQDRYTLLVTALVLLAVISIVALLAAALIARPVRALMAQTRAIGEGAGAVAPIAHPGTREIAELSEAFARMAGLLEQRAEYIRAFAASVSHEFKTPLAAIRGTVELLREHAGSMDQGQRARFLENLDADAARLDRLVRRLLDLARADVLQPGSERVELAPALAAIAERARGEGREIAVDVAPDAGELPLAAATLEAVMDSLIDNAFQHGGPGVRVAVEARPTGDGRVEIVVRDDGAGISPANAERVFEPFFTTSRDRGGTGLGLTIVRSLLRAHEATIALAPTERGTELRIVAPQARSAGA